MGAPVIAHGDPTPILDTVEHDFDFVALPVERFAVAPSVCAVLAGRDTRHDAPAFQRRPEPVSVVPAVRDQLMGVRQAVQQGSGPRVVARLPRRQVQVNGLALTVADRVEFRVQAAFRATDTAGNIPFFSRLAAVLCAFKCVASIISLSGVPRASARKMRLNTPIRLQRTKRL